MSSEIWRAVPGHEGIYEVSSLGGVRSLKTGRTLRPFKHSAGYREVTLLRDGRQKRAKVHALVLTAFVGPRPVGFVCAHLNGNPEDNRLKNLTWATYAENQAHRRLHGTDSLGEKSHRAKLTAADVDAIRDLTSRGLSNRQVAKMFGVTRQTVNDIWVGKSWSHLPSAKICKRAKPVDPRTHRLMALREKFAFKEETGAP